MKILLSAFILLSVVICHGQRVPISAYTYENCTDIDNYFGETDTLILQNNIRYVYLFYKSEKDSLYQRTTYENGKRIRQEEYEKSNRIARYIEYIYSTDALDAYIRHYPSPENFNLWPSPRYYYLERRTANEIIHPYKSDSVTRIVKMHIRHTFKSDGTVKFESYNKDEKLIDTFTLKPLYTWKEYQNKILRTFPNTIKDGNEEYSYNAGGQLLSYKGDGGRERKYYYDNRGLLIRKEEFKNDKLFYSWEYQYGSNYTYER